MEGAERRQCCTAAIHTEGDTKAPTDDARVVNQIKIETESGVRTPDSGVS